MLKVRFVEANREAARNLGVRWAFFKQNGNLAGVVGTQQGPGLIPANGNFPSSTMFPQSATSTSNSFLDVVGGAGGTGSPFATIITQIVNSKFGSLDAVLSALEEQKVVRDLAEPNLIALSGETASFLAGGSYPIPVVSSSGAGGVPYLLIIQKWDSGSIVVVMSIGGIAGLLTQTPAGVLIDAKRGIIIGAAILITVGSLLLPFFPQFSLVALMQVATGASGAIFPPAIAAITLGIVGPKAFSRRVGRNEAFNHAGNATAATLAGGTAYFFGPIAVFWVMAAMAVVSIVATLSIPAGAINHDIARGLTAEQEKKAEQPSGFRVLLECRPLLIFAACVTMFHFANAAMLPLVGQKLALADRDIGTALMSVCIVAAQIVMVPCSASSCGNSVSSQTQSRNDERNPRTVMSVRPAESVPDIGEKEVQPVKRGGRLGHDAGSRRKEVSGVPAPPI